MTFFVALNKRDPVMVDLFSRDESGHACLWAIIHECALEHHQEIMRKIEDGSECAIVFTTKEGYQRNHED